MAAKFEVYKDKKGEFRFRLKATNGETIATGEGYKAKTGCLAGIRAIKKNAPIAPIEDTTVEKTEAKKTAKKPAAAKAKTAEKAKAAPKAKTTAKPGAKPRGRPKAEKKV